MDKVYVEATYKSLNKLNEELCGDRVEIVKNDDSYFVVCLTDWEVVLKPIYFPH